MHTKEHVNVIKIGSLKKKINRDVFEMFTTKSLLKLTLQIWTPIKFSEITDNGYFQIQTQPFLIYSESHF